VRIFGQDHAGWMQPANAWDLFLHRAAARDPRLMGLNGVLRGVGAGFTPARRWAEGSVSGRPLIRNYIMLLRVLGVLNA